MENDSAEVKGFVMYPRWTHWRDLKAELVKAVERQNEILDEKLDDIATAACNPN